MKYFIWRSNSKYCNISAINNGVSFIIFRGSAIAKIVGNNVVEKSDKFEKEVRMWVFEEMVNGRKLTEIINQDHENLKYLPGHKLPENVVSTFCSAVRGSRRIIKL